MEKDEISLWTESLMLNAKEIHKHLDDVCYYGRPMTQDELFDLRLLLNLTTQNIYRLNAEVEERDNTPKKRKFFGRKK